MWGVDLYMKNQVLNLNNIFYIMWLITLQTHKFTKWYLIEKIENENSKESEDDISDSISSITPVERTLKSFNTKPINPSDSKISNKSKAFREEVKERKGEMEKISEEDNDQNSERSDGSQKDIEEELVENNKKKIEELKRW